MFLAFGVTFEVPIAVIILARMGIVTLEQLKHARPYFVVGAFVIAAVVTPPDVISQLLLAIPMCLLYELGLFAARYFVKPKVEDDYVTPSDGELDGVDAEQK
jgi:sec-independent protein translocase protein TatC